MTGIWRSLGVFGTAFLLTGMFVAGCARNAEGPPAAGEEDRVTTQGSIEVTARLVEVPEGAIFQRDLYNYATVLKYQVLNVHRGRIVEDTIFVGHYNPFKSRREAADRHVADIGGNLKSFEAGQIHRMALEVPIDDHYMGGIVNKYFRQDAGPIYWAVWVDLASQ